MLQLLLTILKILGILVLVILGIILAVLLIVLLVPIRYRGDVSFEGKPQGGVLVSWLLRIVTVRLDYDGSVLRALVKVLWFRLFEQTLWPSEKAEEVAEDAAETLTEDEFFADVALTDPMEDAQAENQISIPKEASPESQTLVQKEASAENPTSAQKETPTETQITKPEEQVVQNQPQSSVQPSTQTVEEALSEPALAEEKPGFLQRLKQKISGLKLPSKKTADSSEIPTETSEEPKKSFVEVFGEKIYTTVTKLIEKVKAVYTSLTGKYTAAQEKIAMVQDFLGNTENQNTIRLIWRRLMKIIKHILPTKLRGRVKFGFDDPATTGQILTYISPFYGVYAKTLAIEPVFDEKVMEGELHLNGRIRLGTLFWNVVRVFLNKNFRMLLKKLLKRNK